HRPKHRQGFPNVRARTQCYNRQMVHFWRMAVEPLVSEREQPKIGLALTQDHALRKVDFGHVPELEQRARLAFSAGNCITYRMPQRYFRSNTVLGRPANDDSVRRVVSTQHQGRMSRKDYLEPFTRKCCKRLPQTPHTLWVQV